MVSSSSSPSEEYATYPSLRGKIVVITGGAEGIGAACTTHFARQGSEVLILHIATASAEALIASVTSTSTYSIARSAIIAPTFHPCDVSSLPCLQAVAQQIIAEHGKVDILINNAAAAGANARQGTFSVTPESWDWSLNINLRPIFSLTQYLVPSMPPGSSIVNLGSITWRIPSVGVPVYAAAKAAIMGLTRTHAREFGAERGIRVNSVMPGAIATERQVKEVVTEEYRGEVWSAQALKRDLMPEEVARVVLFLGSGEAGAVTGADWVVDGGWVGDA